RAIHQSARIKIGSATMSESFTFDFQQILPDVILCLFGITILIADPFVGKARKALLGIVGLFGILAAAIATVNMTGNDIVAVFSGMIIVDKFGLFFRFVFLLVSGLTLLASLDYLKKQNLNL